jgi:hypothetical protein
MPVDQLKTWLRIEQEYTRALAQLQARARVLAGLELEAQEGEKLKGRSVHAAPSLAGGVAQA